MDQLPYITVMNMHIKGIEKYKKLMAYEGHPSH